MLKKLWKFTRNQKRNVLKLLFFIAWFPAWGVNGYIPVDDTEIKLADGRKIITIRRGDHSHTLLLKKGNKVLWAKTFEEEYDRLWSYAFFVPVKKGQYTFDLNKEGLPELAVGAWDGGNSMANRDVILFTLKENELIYYGRHPFNLEFGEYVFR